jgi:hypothetical protein
VQQSSDENDQVKQFVKGKGEDFEQRRELSHFELLALKAKEFIKRTSKKKGISSSTDRTSGSNIHVIERVDDGQIKLMAHSRSFRS